jgi:hypothetical protein
MHRFTFPVVLCAAVFGCGAGATAAQAPQFTAPNVPQAIANPNVSAGPDSSGSGFDIAIGYALSCPNGQPQTVSVVFNTPSGSITNSLADPCAGTWNPNAADATFLGATITQTAGTQPASSPAITFDWPGNLTGAGALSGSEPFDYQVTTASGVVAQGALTEHVSGTPPTIIDSETDIDDYINICIDGGYTIYSRNGGDLYCETSDGTVSETFTTGWPAPIRSYIKLFAIPLTVNTCKISLDAFAALKPVTSHLKSYLNGTFTYKVVGAGVTKTYSEKPGNVGIDLGITTGTLRRGTYRVTATYPGTATISPASTTQSVALNCAG